MFDSNTSWVLCTHGRESTKCVRIDGASMPSIDQHLGKSFKEIFCTLYELIYGCAAQKGGGVGPSIDTRGVNEVSQVSDLFLLLVCRWINELNRGLINYLGDYDAKLG